jgi:cellulose synthase/poly-beta-1,6-N-acetylglucosamine synthase-like glycosyltransferase
LEAKIAGSINARKAVTYIIITLVGFAIFILPALYNQSYLNIIATVNTTILLFVTIQFYGSIFFGLVNRKTPDPPEEWPTVSILIPAYNEEQVLARTMESMLHLDYPHDKIEFVYVYESKSTDRTEDIILEYAKRDARFKPVCREEAHGGKAAAANYGIRQSSGEIIGSFDADHSLEPDSVRRAVLHFSDPNIVCVKGRCRTINKEEGVLAKIAGVERDIAENLVIPQHDVIGGFSFFGGGHAFFRKKIFEEIGYFDENIMCEDVDYSIKIHKAGYNIRVDPTVVSWEESPADFNQWWHQRKRWSRGWIQCALTHIRSIPGHPKFSFIKKLDTLYYLIITIMLPMTLLLYPSGIIYYLGYSPESFYPNWFVSIIGVAITLSSVFAFAAVQYKDHKRGENVRWREIPVIFELVVYMPMLLFVSWVGWVDEFLLNSEKEYVKTMRSGVNSGTDG